MFSSDRSALLIVGAVVGLALTGGAVAELSGFTDDGTVEVVAVSDTEQVRVDNPVQVSATISNTHGTERVSPVALRFDTDGDGELATTVAKRNVTVPAEASTDVTFTVPAETLDPGSYEYSVIAGDDSATTERTRNVTALRPPTFAVEGTSDSLTVLRGNETTATAVIRNDGDLAGVATTRIVVDDGTGRSETILVRGNVSLGAGEEERVEFAVPTGSIEPGTYDYRVATANASAAGTLTVERPATFRIEKAPEQYDVTRGATANLSVTLTNAGDVAGDTTLAAEGINGTATPDRNATLDPGESTNLTVPVDTANVSRGNYTLTLSTTGDTEPVEFRVRDSAFEVTRVDGNDTLTIGDVLRFTATVRNAGDANDTQTVAARIDIDGDDRPESHGVDRRLTLASGEQTDVTITVPYEDGGDSLDAVRSEPDETYVYGVYSDDDNATDVFATKSRTRSVSGGSSGGGPRATRDEISQQKYSYYYDQVSGETQGQINEIYQRQPFVDGRDVTDVRTREEIARQKYDLDVQEGDEFAFAELDVDVQQRIEADFDAQFRSDTGDRVESWDEIAQSRYGSAYEDLTSSRQQTVRDAYRDQF